jgi:hypothetical protein
VSSRMMRTLAREARGITSPTFFSLDPPSALPTSPTRRARRRTATDRRKNPLAAPRAPPPHPALAVLRSPVALARRSLLGAAPTSRPTMRPTSRAGATTRATRVSCHWGEGEGGGELTMSSSSSSYDTEAVRKAKGWCHTCRCERRPVRNDDPSRAPAPPRHSVG